MDFLQKIIRWGKEEDAIKALLLQGSRAGNAGFDQFSDYDVTVFCSEPSAFTDVENWLSQIGDVWVCIKETIRVIYLKRNDLWSVKFRANAMHEFLLQMIQWHAETQKNWKEKSEPLGKNMKLWVDSATWNALQEVFAHFDVQNSWRALFSTLDLFRRLSADVARHLGYDYPIAIDKNMSEFIVTLSESS